MCAKRFKQRKEKVKTWEKIKCTHKSHFLPISYLQDSYSHLYNLAQGAMSIEEYTREFEKLVIKCDLQVAED